MKFRNDRPKPQIRNDPFAKIAARFALFFHPDHPDASRKKTTNYSPTVVTNEIGLLQEPPPTKVLKGMPTNCKDLQLLGHKLNGFYLIKTSKNNIETKMETVYCDFQLQTSLNGTFEKIYCTFPYYQTVIILKTVNF